jgi:hypothetical protein
MRHAAVAGLLMALCGCAYDQSAALDRCQHKPGCVSADQSSGMGPSQQRAIEAGSDGPRR